jgi:hypothetical protein
MPATQQTRPKEVKLNFRSTPTEAEQLRQWAADQGTTVAAAIRAGLAIQGFKPKEN